MTYYRVCIGNNTTDATRGAGSAHPSRSPDFTPSFSGIRVARSQVFCVLLCRLLCVILSFLFGPMCCLSFDLRLLKYHVGVFKHFLCTIPLMYHPPYVPPPLMYHPPYVPPSLCTIPLMYQPPYVPPAYVPPPYVPSP